MAYPTKFLNLANFELAFTRVANAGNFAYKLFYRHLIGSYQLGRRENLLDLIEDVREGTYQPGSPLVVYLPKESGVLRPITILSLNDLILYQAIMNYVALKMATSQRKYALAKTFGAILASKDNSIFFRSWRVGYRAYYDAMVHAFRAGNDHVADFDLVSFYELIDHKLLRRILSRRIDSTEVLDLLFMCLDAWRKNRRGESIHHGIPQGPDPSVFLAECVLFCFDSLNLKGVTYLRYIDDIKLMAKGAVPLRRSLVRLDLESKALGLVPQAQKIAMLPIKDVTDIVKIVPSGLLLGVSKGMRKAAAQQKLLRTFRGSLSREGRGWKVQDVTNFKYSLLRLKRRRDVLRRIRPFLLKRPDLSWVLSQYLKQFEHDREAAEALFHALREDPVYDAAAMDYIQALDVCEPATGYSPYRRVINTAVRRSEEKSVLIRLACLTFRGKRSGVADALRMIDREREPLIKSMVIHRLFVEDGAPYRLQQCRAPLEKEVESENSDFARYCASLLLQDDASKRAWITRGNANNAVKLLTKAVGLRRKGPRKPGIVATFFTRDLGIGIPFPWKRALGKNLRDAESRVLNLQRLALGPPDPRILMLDTFNEVLLQAFSKKHPALNAGYRAAAGANPQPDFGAWLGNDTLKGALPKGIGWFRWVHRTRVGAQMSHATHRGGPRKGLATRPVSRSTADRIFKAAPIAYAELLNEWRKVV